MAKKIASLLLVISILATVWIPTAFAAGETTRIDSVVATTIPVTSYSNYSLNDRVYTEYASIGPSKWIDYIISVPKSMEYEIMTYCASNQTTAATLRFTIDGALAGSAKIERTGSWNDFSNSFYAGKAFIEAGTHTLRVTGGGISIHYASTVFTPVIDKSELNDFSKKEGAYKEAFLPTTIEAENFDIGPDGHYSLDEENETRKYRKDDGIDILEAASGNVIALAKGEYTKYTFNVEYAGAYSFDITCGGTADFSVYFDDAKNPLKFVTKEKSYSDTLTVDMYLEAGVHTLKLQCDEWLFNSAETRFKVDKLNFISSNAKKEDCITIEDLEKTAFSVPYSEEPDYDMLDKENEVYKNIYVSVNGSDNGDGSKSQPFATMQRAVDELAKITDGMTGDIVVNFEKGVHFIDETIFINNKHGGKNGYNVIFRGVSEEKPVLSGGVEVTGWEKHDEHIWKAPLDGVDEVRNLYINDYPATRAKSKYFYMCEAFYNEEGDDSARGSGFITSAVNFPKFEHPEDLETCWPAAWLMSFHPVDDVIYDGDKVIFLMEKTSWSYPHGASHGANPNMGFYLENAMELLTDPGEFYYNKEEKMIYYYPYEAEDMTTATTYAGKTELLFDIKGESKDNRVKNIVFDNLSVKYGAWHHVSNHGIVCRQADECRDLSTKSYSSKILSPGQLTVNNADNLVVKDCEFMCLGSSAMHFNDSVSNVKIEGNLIRDNSGGGIIVGSYKHSTEDGTLASLGVDPCKNFMIRDNVIARTADEYFFQTGISVYYESNVNIIRNYVDQVPYTGITVGWGWESSVDRSVYHKNIKLYNNYFGRTMQYLKDGGSLYTLGNLGGMEVAYNHFADYKGRDHGMGGIYNDAGSSNFIAHHNVIEPEYKEGTRWLHSQKGYGVGDSKYYSNYATTQNHDSDGANNIDIELPHLLKKGVEYPQEALDIIANAGPSDEYKDLIEKAALPSWRKWRVKQTAEFMYKDNEIKPIYGWIEAENFIPGNNGETYYDISEGEYNNNYRKEATGLLYGGTLSFSGLPASGYTTQNVANGEWMTYSASVPEDGYYKFMLQYACGNTTYIDLYIDNKLVLDNAKLPSSGGWYTMKTYAYDGIYLEAGEHVLRYVFASGGQYLDRLGLFPQDGEIVETEDEATTVTTSENYDECTMIKEEPEPVVATFTDIDGHYAREDILVMAASKMIKGYDPYTFGPEDSLTREQAALIVMRAGRLAFDEANWEDAALEYGLITERGNEKAVITREEFAHFILCVYAKINGNYKVTLGNDYKDNDQISEKFYFDVLAAREAGLLKGDTNGNFRPKDGLTRAEGAVAAKRIAFN